MTTHQTQCQQILNLLNRSLGEEVYLLDILALQISQYGARIKELREEGHHIVNRSEWVGRARHSWFRLIPKEQ